MLKAQSGVAAEGHVQGAPAAVAGDVAIRNQGVHQPAKFRAGAQQQGNNAGVTGGGDGIDGLPEAEATQQQRIVRGDDGVGEDLGGSILDGDEAALFEQGSGAEAA